MDDIDGGFCFYDDPDFAGDADRDSRKLRSWHQRLWSKPLPNGQRLDWTLEPGTMCLAHGDVRVSSDTIATAHSGYFGAKDFWRGLPEVERTRYDRSIYRIGAFIIFPVRPQSLNQRRGTASAISDRFDLTLECIRQHYLGLGDNPLAEVLAIDSQFFQLFGDGQVGFINYVKFFHLEDLVADGTIRWFDEFDGNEWDFAALPLPQSAALYRRYLDNVEAFVAARSDRIQDWCRVHR